MRQAIATGVLILLLHFSIQAQISDFSGVDFQLADSIARSYAGHSLGDLKTLSEKLTRPLLSDVEKFRAIFTWVCLNIENDPVLYFRNRKHRDKSSDQQALRKWNKEFHQDAVKNLIDRKRTVCTGYAFLVKELSYHAGLDCKIVDGYGRTAAANTTSLDLPNHSWNAVKLQDKWYLCDPTWSSGVIDKTSMTFIRRFDTAYFLPEPSLFIRNHYPIDTGWILMSSKPTKTDFVNGPLIYIAAYQHNIKLQSPSTFKLLAAKGEKLTFQFTSTSADEIKKVSLVVENIPASDKAVQSKVDDQATQFSIEHIFKTRGEYDVHLYVNEKPAVTYAVSVR